MNRTIKMIFLGFLLIGTLSAQTAWTLDRPHSGVKFTVRHMVVTDVEGSFKDFDIVVKSDKDDFTDASLDATIKVASISTDNERRDNHLKSDDFFNAEKFPTLTFKSTKFEKTGEKSYKIYGDMTIRDVTKPVVFDAVYGGTLSTQRSKVAGWKATLTVNRFDYNLKWDRTIEDGGLVVSKDVVITVNVEIRK